MAATIPATKEVIEMIGPRVSVAGLLLLTALLVSAFAAQSASAAKSVNTTAVTCVTEPSAKGDFSDAHCDSSSPEKGNFAHSLIPLGTTTEIDATNEKVTEETKKSEPAVLKGKIALAKVTIECAVVKNLPEKSLLHNVETEGKHTVTGEVAVEYRSCEVKEMAKCVIAEPVVAEATFEGVEKLGAGKNEMGVEFKGKGAEETFTNIEFKNKGAEACSLNGKQFPAKGSAIGTSGPTTEAGQTNEWSGSTLVFTSKNQMQKMTLGPEPAEFTSIVTPRMAGECGGSAIAATTLT